MRPPGPFNPCLKTAPTPNGLPGDNFTSVTEDLHSGLLVPSRTKSKTSFTGRSIVIDSSACAMSLSLLPVGLFIFQCSPDPLRCCWVFVNIDANGIKDGIAHRGRNPIHGDFGNSLHAKWMTWLERFHKDGFERRHLISAEDVITVQVALDGIAFFIVA